MLGCLPEFLPDELLYSVIAAWTDRLPFFRQAALHLAFSEKAYKSIHDLPNNLSFFLSQLPPHYHMTLDRLINNHTLYPYYAATLPVERREQLWNLMCSSSGSGIHAVAGIPLSIIRSPEWFRYCPICITEDRKEYGRAYWHRVHQLAGVLVCPTHHAFLENTDIPLRFRFDSRSTMFISLNEVQTKNIVVRYDSPDYNINILIGLAENTMYLLNNPGIVLDVGEMIGRYDFIFDKRGYSGAKIKRYMLDFLKEFIQHYSSDFLNQISGVVDIHNVDNWVRSTINGRHGKKHPLCHLLIINFFSLSVENFLQLPDKRQTFGEGPWPCHNPFCTHYNTLCISAHHIHSARAALIGTFTCVCGFSYTMKISKGKDLGLTKELEFEVRDRGSVWERAFIDIWNDKNLSLDKKSKILGIRPSTIIRYGQYLGLTLPPPGSHSSITSIEGMPRYIPSPSRGKKIFIWKGRRKSHTNYEDTYKKVHQPIDWQDRDTRTYDQLKEIAKKLCLLDERSRRINARSICRHLGNREAKNVLRNLHRLPKTAGFLAETIDTDESYALRAIEWAGRECKKNKTRLSRNAFLRFASISHLEISEIVLQALEDTLSDIDSSLDL